MVKRLVQWIYGLKADKYLHCFAGMVVAQVAYVLLAIALPKWACMVLSVVAVAVIGGVKELVDVKYGVPSWKDFVATVTGAFVELPIMLML